MARDQPDSLSSVTVECAIENCGVDAFGRCLACNAPFCATHGNGNRGLCRPCQAANVPQCSKCGDIAIGACKSCKQPLCGDHFASSIDVSLDSVPASSPKRLSICVVCEAARESAESAKWPQTDGNDVFRELELVRSAFVKAMAVLRSTAEPLYSEGAGRLHRPTEAGWIVGEAVRHSPIPNIDSTMPNPGPDGIPVTIGITTQGELWSLQVVRRRTTLVEPLSRWEQWTWASTICSGLRDVATRHGMRLPI